MPYFFNMMPKKISTELGHNGKSIDNRFGKLAKDELRYTTVSMDDDSSEDNRKGIEQKIGNTQLNEYLKKNSETVSIDEIYPLILAVVRMKQSKGKAGADKLTLVHTSYTAGIIENTKVIDDYVDKEDEIIQSLNIDFLDLFKRKKCRTIIDILTSPNKYMDEILGTEAGDKREICNTPVKPSVYIRYGKLTGQRIGGDTVTKYEKKYKEISSEVRMKYEQSL